MTFKSTLPNVSCFNINDKNIAQEFDTFFDKQISIGALGRKLPALMMSLVCLTPMLEKTEAAQWTATCFYNLSDRKLNIYLLTDDPKFTKDLWDPYSKYSQIRIELDFDLPNSKAITRQWFSKWKFSHPRAYAFISTFENKTHVIVFKGEYVADMPCSLDRHNDTFEEICRFQVIRTKKSQSLFQRFKSWVSGKSTVEEDLSIPVLQRYTLTKKSIDNEPRPCDYADYGEAHKDPIVI